METWLCINEFLEQKCWGKESQKSEDGCWSYHHYFNLFFCVVEFGIFSYTNKQFIRRKQSNVKKHNIVETDI